MCQDSPLREHSVLMAYCLLSSTHMTSNIWNVFMSVAPKLNVADFHYNVIHIQFEWDYNHICSDTGSSVHNIKRPHMYGWIEEDI